MNYKRIEAILFSINELKTEITNLNIDIEELKDDICFGGASDNPQAGYVTVRTNVSMVESQAEQREKQISFMERQIRTKQRRLAQITNAIETLNADDKRLVQLRYVDKIPVTTLAIRFGVEPNTIYKRKDGVIKRLSSLLQ